MLSKMVCKGHHVVYHDGIASDSYLKRWKKCIRKCKDKYHLHRRLCRTFWNYHWSWLISNLREILWSSASLFKTNISLQGATLKRSSKKMSVSKQISYFVNLSVLFKNTFLFNGTKVFVVNWLKWHNKLQHLLCGAFCNQWKWKKSVVPLNSKASN